MKTKSKKFYRKLIETAKKEILAELEQQYQEVEESKNELDIPMTSLEITEYYGIHMSTLNRYLRQGLVSQSKGKNCRRFFTKRNFNQFITKNKKRNNGQN